MCYPIDPPPHDTPVLPADCAVGFLCAHCCGCHGQGTCRGKHAAVFCLCQRAAESSLQFSWVHGTSSACAACLAADCCAPCLRCCTGVQLCVLVLCNHQQAPTLQWFSELDHVCASNQRFLVFTPIVVQGVDMGSSSASALVYHNATSNHTSCASACVTPSYVACAFECVATDLCAPGCSSVY